MTFLHDLVGEKSPFKMKRKMEVRNGNTSKLPTFSQCIDTMFASQFKLRSSENLCEEHDFQKEK